MKWGRKNRAKEQKKTKKKTSSFLPSSHSFQLSNFFTFSWISHLKREKQSRINPKQFPPSDAPRRRSTGEDDRRKDRADISRSTRHYSLGELELDLRPISSFRKREDYSPPPTPMKRGQRMRPKVKAFSPKAARRRAKEAEKRKRRNFESFAVVKSSSDPQKDFRESMEEMIREKGMRRPEEMERLLACYISLNSGETHDFIIKAFRQVWFNLGAGWFAGERHCCHCCDCF